MPDKEEPRLWRHYKQVGSALPKKLTGAFSVGSLEAGIEGLLLFTNDADARRLMELASTGWVRHYRVKAKGRADDALLAALQDGIEVSGVHYGPIEAAYDAPKSWLHIVLREGRNRGVAGVCAFLKLDKPRIMRLAFGPFELGGLGAGAIEEVPPPQWRGALGGKFGQTHEDRGRAVQGAKSRSARK